MVFSGLNTWAGGATYHTLDIVFALLSLPIMVLGAGMFRYFEADDQTKRGDLLGQDKPLLDVASQDDLYGTHKTQFDAVKVNSY